MLHWIDFVRPVFVPFVDTFMDTTSFHIQTFKNLKNFLDDLASMDSKSLSILCPIESKQDISDIIKLYITLNKNPEVIHFQITALSSFNNKKLHELLEQYEIAIIHSPSIKPKKLESIIYSDIKKTKNIADKKITNAEKGIIEVRSTTGEIDVVALLAESLDDMIDKEILPSDKDSSTQHTRSHATFDLNSLSPRGSNLISEKQLLKSEANG